MKSITDNFELLDLVMCDQLKQSGVYKPGPYWQAYANRISRHIKKDSLAEFRSNINIGKGYADTVNLGPFQLDCEQPVKNFIYRFVAEFPLLRKYWFNRYDDYIRSYHEQAVQHRSCCYDRMLSGHFTDYFERYGKPDALVASPTDTITIAGENMGIKYFQAILRIINTSDHVPYQKLQSMIEIGGGFGAMTHTLLHSFPNIRKVIYLDIPPNLYIGTQYLRTFYGDAVRDYMHTAKMDKITFSDDDELEILAIAPWQLKNIEADLGFLWNAESFQEMTLDIVSNYASILSGLMSPDANLGLYFYGDHGAANTLRHQNVLDVVTESLDKTFSSITPVAEVSDASYYIA